VELQPTHALEAPARKSADLIGRRGVLGSQSRLELRDDAVDFRRGHRSLEVHAERQDSNHQSPDADR
jgi:hypothetical protein